MMRNKECVIFAKVQIIKVINKRKSLEIQIKIEVISEDEKLYVNIRASDYMKIPKELN